MILGLTVTGPELVVLGSTLLLLTALQVMVGLRWIKLGKNHFKIHKWTGIAILVFAALHAIVGTTFALGLSIL